jgi:rubrerythrin
MASEEIRREQPIQNTIHNLIQTLSVKLDSAARYGVYQEDASREGYEDVADFFVQLDTRELEDIRALLGLLKGHIGQADTGPIGQSDAG